MIDGRAMPRQTVILAAGNGLRLGGLSGHHPKPLLRVGGKPLIEHALAQAAAAGCLEAVVVVGSGAGQVEKALGGLQTRLELEVVLNPDYDLPNGVSLLAAEPHVEERFFLQMADHVFAQPVLGRLTQAAPHLDGEMRLLVDYEPQNLDEDDATKVRIDGNHIIDIGKSLRPYHAIDAGCFLLDRRVFGALRAAQGEEPPSVSAGMLRLAQAGELAPMRLTGVPWVDVDTPRDWERAEALLTGERRGTPARR